MRRFVLVSGDDYLLLVRNCIGKNYQKSGHWRLASKVAVYKEVEAVRRTIKKKRL